MATDLSRFPASAVVIEYLARHIDGEIAIDGTPGARIVIDSHRNRLGIRVPADGPPPTLPALENLVFTEVLEGASNWFDLSVPAGLSATDVYAVLCGVLDRIQLEHQGFGQAVVGVISSLRHLLSFAERLTRQQQVGLMGELLTLLSAIQWLGEESAVKSWRGQSREEHDFGFAEFDLEVKTTIGESRRHVISGVHQLMPTRERPLYLLSFQLTSAGGQPGWTLPRLVTAARHQVAHRDALEDALKAGGYRDDDGYLYSESWVPRTKPAFYLVDAQFPAITGPRLAVTVPHAELVEDVHYRVNIEGLTPSPDPLPMKRFTDIPR